jgi:hypothetical protein
MTAGKIASKPCPFCGGTAEVRAYDKDGFVVGCTHNGTADPNLCAVAPQTLPMVTEAAAVEAWNERKG